MKSQRSPKSVVGRWSRSWADDGQLFHNPVREGFPTIHQLCSFSRSAAFREPSGHTTRFDNRFTVTVFPDRKIRGISMARISAQTHFSMLLRRAGSTPDTQGHGLIKRLVCQSANCWRRCSSFVADCARPWLPPQDPMTVRSPIPSRWSRPQTRPPGLHQSTTFTSQKVFSAPPGRPTESKSYSPVTLLAAPICGK
jgi:hypothetical protein